MGAKALRQPERKKIEGERRSRVYVYTYIHRGKTQQPIDKTRQLARMPTQAPLTMSSSSNFKDYAFNSKGILYGKVRSQSFLCTDHFFLILYQHVAVCF